MDHSLSRSLDEEEEQGFVALANELLTKFNLSAIAVLSEFQPSSFIALYEGILGDTLPDLIQKPVTREDEIHNTQKVIDSLAVDILRTDLSHITGESIIDGDFVAVRNLIEIFAGLFEYVMEAISSEGGSTDADVDAISDDPDVLTSGALSTISDVLKEELGADYNGTYNLSSRKPDLGERWEGKAGDNTQPGDTTADLIKLGETGVLDHRNDRTKPSPAKSDMTTSSSKYDADVSSYVSNGILRRKALDEQPQPNGADNTQDLIRDSEDWMAKVREYRERWGHEHKDPYSPGKASTTVTDQSTTSSPLVYRSKLREPYSPARSYLTTTTDSLASSPMADRHPRPDLVSTSKPSPVIKSTLPSSAVSSPSKSVTFSDVQPKRTDPRQASMAREKSVSPVKTPGARRRIDTSFDSPKTRKIAWAGSDKPAKPSTSRQRSPKPGVPSPRKDRRSDSPVKPRQTVKQRVGEDRPRTAASYRERSPRKPIIRKERGMRERREQDRMLEEAANLRQYRDVIHSTRDRERQPMMIHEDEANVSYHSDSEIDYGHIWNMLKEARERPHRHGMIIESESEDDLDIRPKYGRSPPRRLQQTQFEAALDADAKGPMARVRKQLRKEDQKRQVKTEIMKHLYENHLQDVKYAQKKTISEKKRKVKKIDQIYKTVNKRPMSSSKYKAQSKYSASVSKPTRYKPASAPTTPIAKKRKKTTITSPGRVAGIKAVGPLTVHEDDLLPTMLSEFPFLHVSPQTAHDMWSKQMRQIEQLAKAEEDHIKKTKTQRQLEEAESRQKILMSIMRKELAHNQRMRDMREKTAQQQLVKTRIRENRLATARARRYYEEFQQRMRAKMLKRRTKEEQIFKKLFEDGLDIQKGRIKELRSYAKEKREALAKRQQDEIDSLENYYKDQFNMLAETISRERYDLQVRDRAQSKVMERMKKELRQKMEKEIQDLQENMHREEDTAYFRQLEADRMRRELHLATYKTQFD
ncbi:centrosomal protein of 95 kDa-like [Glandiceps talaboti]